MASAPTIFQRTIDSILQGIPKVFCYIDDILITGADDKEYLWNLAEVLNCLEAHGIKLKKAICKFLADAVEYLGNKVDANEIHTSNHKVEAMQKALPPRTVQQLQSFLGLVHYYGKFISNLSSLLQHLNNLLKSNARWKWTVACKQTFLVAKEKLATAPVLAHYNPVLPLN